MTMLHDDAKRQLQEEGWCVFPALLDAQQVRRVNEALDRIVEEMRRRGASTHSPLLDPNGANVRVYNLPDWDPVFVELLRHPACMEIAQEVLGEGFIVSNFTGNIAHPGSQPMRIHSDQALSVPGPWLEPWALNLIWCLDDVYDANGATRFVPGSHKYTCFSEVPEDIAERTVAFEAPAGSLIAMEGRVWHTSGSNRTEGARRAMLFGYYVRDFVRQQVNWDVCLSPATQDSLDDEARALLGMGPKANVRIGSALSRLTPDAERPDILSRGKREDA
ncbi:phytanoyl-CoA dioxygenase family protein [Sphingobium tyrosinilyticum]|uniref:Phytanoyl-CoA dioxygenase family protein n=1 Tax=Sphingobium tyrosinilyticum TaxID=2715436 RepID=A0ABV9F478_9SPHN